MKLTKKTINLICELEDIVGHQCYNPSSYDPFDMSYGRWIRYPIHYVNNKGMDTVSKYQIDDINKNGIEKMAYYFGANRLYIGEAIVRILSKLERDFDLDFNELTKKAKPDAEK